MWDILPGTLYQWYRNHLSDYKTDSLCGEWPSRSVLDVDQNTGEVFNEKPIYILKPEHIGEQMSIDDKSIGHDIYTILSNTRSGKIAMLIESTRADELEKALGAFGKDLLKVKSISCDMSATYLKLCKEQMPHAKTVVDKFHVMQYVYDAILDVRSRIKKNLAQELSKGKEKTEKDKEILYDIELLKRCRYRLTQSPDKWSAPVKDLMTNIFSKHKTLKMAYDLSQDFKTWYDTNTHINDKTRINDKLINWFYKVKETKIEEFIPTIKMIRKHQYEIVNYFFCKHTNANAESLNGKIQRFVVANYGLRDKDFALYRIAGYFS
jgi:transposase